MNNQDVLPELSLLDAIIDRAVRDIVEAKDIRAVRGAREWIRSNSLREFSFMWCCEHLQLDPERIRADVASLEFDDRNTQKPAYDAMVRKFSNVFDGEEFELVTGRERLRYG